MQVNKNQKPYYNSILKRVKISELEDCKSCIIQYYQFQSHHEVIISIPLVTKGLFFFIGKKNLLKKDYFMQNNTKQPKVILILWLASLVKKKFILQSKLQLTTSWQYVSPILHWTITSSRASLLFWNFLTIWIFRV